MYTFASTYTTGLSDYVKQWLKEDIQDVEILNNYDGLIIYKTKKEVLNLPYINNSFLVLDLKPCLKGGVIHTLKI